MTKEECKKHQWVTTKVSVTMDDNYHPPRPVEVPVERICFECGFITSNFGEDTWDDGRLYHVNGYWDNIKEIYSFDDVVNITKSKKEVWIRYCPVCGYQHPFDQKGYCCQCGFEFKKIVKKGLRVKKKEKKKRDLVEDFMFYVWMPVVLMILCYIFLMMLGLV
jgi:hypothetical protein